MELDSVESQLTVLDVQQPAVMLEDPEPLPNVILGSEPWHGQVPEVSRILTIIKTKKIFCRCFKKKCSKG